MDIFQRRWEMQRREYLELINEYLAIERRWTDALRGQSIHKTTVIPEMVENYMSPEMIAHALSLSVREVEDIIAAFKKYRSENRTWEVIAKEFKERTSKEVISTHTQNFYRIRQEFSYDGPGDYVLSDEPFDEELYSLYPDFVREQNRYGF